MWIFTLGQEYLIVHLFAVFFSFWAVKKKK